MRMATTVVVLAVILGAALLFFVDRESEELPETDVEIEGGVENGDGS